MLAAAIKAKAHILVTWNQLDLSREAVYGAVHDIADSWTSPPGTLADVLDRLENDGLVRLAAALRS